MNVLMVVAPCDFRDEELVAPRRALEYAGHTVTIASSREGRCVGVYSVRVTATVALAQVETSSYSAVVFVGGPGARELFADAHAQRIAADLHRQQKVVSAIDISPVILARAGVLAGRRATVFENEVRELVVGHALVRSLGVVSDGNLVTANGPTHVQQFTDQVLKALVAAARPVVGARPQLAAAAN